MSEIIKNIDLSSFYSFWEESLQDYHRRIQITFVYKNIELVCFKNFPDPKARPHDPRVYGYDSMIQEVNDFSKIGRDYHLMKMTCMQICGDDIAFTEKIYKEFNSIYLWRKALKVARELNKYEDSIRLFDFSDNLLPHVLIDFVKDVFYELNISGQELFDYSSDNIFVARV